MNNLQWLPGMQYALTLISNPNTYNTEHQTHIWHYKEYFSKPILANRDYNYIRHTKPTIAITTPNITYTQYLELRDKFPFYLASFATMDLSKLNLSPSFYASEVSKHMINHPLYQFNITQKTINDNIEHFICINPTYKIIVGHLRTLHGWEANPQITPEMIFDDIKYDEKGFVTSVGKRKIQKGDSFMFQQNPNFYCFFKNPDLLEYNTSWFAFSPAGMARTNILDFISSNRIMINIIKDIVNPTDFIVKPRNPNAIYEAIMNRTITSEYRYQMLNHIIHANQDYNVSYRSLQQNKKQIYLHTHIDPVKYDIDRL